MISLGRLKLSNPYILAPMSMYSDICLRKICNDYGCSYSFTEQIHTRDFIKEKLDKKKLDFYDMIGIQFITDDPEELKQAIKIVNEKKLYPRLENIRSIDLNLGCPTKEIMEKNLGSALLNQPNRIRELFKVMKTHSILPISAKIRLAINAKHKKTKPYLRIAKIAEEEGLDFLTIHARNAGQMYEGDIDIEAIKEVSENISIPMIGNGNITDEKSAGQMLKYCKAIMIGRKAVTDPFIFRQLSYYRKEGKKLKLDIKEEKIACIKKYLKLAEEYDVGLQHIKIHMQGLLKGIKGQQPLITKLTHISDRKELNLLINEFLKNNS